MLAEVARGVAPSLVVVEYWLRYDKGQQPGGPLTSGGGSRWEADGGRERGSDLVREERPLELAGFLVAGDRVVTNDIGMHERFIASIRVRYGDTSVAAEPGAYAVRSDAVVLKLKSVLPGARPLTFDTTAAEPYLAVNYGRPGGIWAPIVTGVSAAAILGHDGAFVPVSASTLVIDSTGTAVGLLMNRRLPLGDRWKGTPLSWELESASSLRKRIDALRARADESLVHVKMRFRSPRGNGRDPYGDWSGGQWVGENMSATEAHAVGVALRADTVLVLLELPSAATARLEGITLTTSDGRAVEASFVGSLTDFGALLVAPVSPLKHAIPPAKGNVRDMQHRLVLRARVSMAGKQRIAYYWHGRIGAFEPRYRGILAPKCGTQDQEVFLFTRAGELLALPLAPRPKGSLGRDDAWRYEPAPSMPVALLRPLLADPAAHCDSNNVPLNEELESRIAWMGVVLQPLDRDLARANGVAEQTDDGASGALVSYVYEGSPADKAGIEAGMIFLRVNAEGHPRPFVVRLNPPSWDEPFPWDQLDDIPEDILDRVPPPWPPATNQFTRMLTQIGFGVRYRAEFVGDGKQFERELTTVASPPHFESAPRYKAQGLGLTVRDLTFEIRRYFQKSDGDPGVVVSKVEPGSRSAVAGVKPFELITHLNGRAISSVEQFRERAAKADELRLSVERMGRSRQVRIKLSK